MCNIGPQNRTNEPSKSQEHNTFIFSTQWAQHKNGKNVTQPKSEPNYLPNRLDSESPMQVN